MIYGFDLIEEWKAPIRVGVWINIYIGSNGETLTETLHKTKDEAIKHRTAIERFGKYVNTIYIEAEEYRD